MLRHLTGLVLVSWLMLAGCTAPGGRVPASSAIPPGGHPSLWPVSCKQDPITDMRTCTTYHRSLYVTLIRQHELTLASVSIVHGELSHPGRLHWVRIDTWPPHSTSEDALWTGKAAENIIAELLQGTTASTRLIVWPYGTAIDETLSLSGFPQAWRQLQEASKQP